MARSVEALKLQNILVITMVARDDLQDGGASHLKHVVHSIRALNRDVTIELLTSDFQGSKESLALLLENPPEIFNHNVETVRRLTPRVRHRATYERSLGIYRSVEKRKSSHPN